MIQNNRQNAHQEIDHIFKELLPAQGMAERPVQVALSHRMLDAMLDDSIALCDAGTGIGKTYAYLVAGIVFVGPRRRGLQISRCSFLPPVSPCRTRCWRNTCPFSPLC